MYIYNISINSVCTNMYCNVLKIDASMLSVVERECILIDT